MSTNPTEPQGAFEDIQLSDNSDISSEASYDIVSNAGSESAQKLDAEDIELNTNGTSEEIENAEEYQDLESEAEIERFRHEIKNKARELLDMVLSSSAYESILSDDDNPLRAKARELVALFGDDIEDNEKTIYSLKSDISSVASYMNKLKTSYTEMRSNFCDATSKFDKMKSELDSTSNAYAQCQEKLREARTVISGAKEENAVFKADNEVFKNRLAVLASEYQSTLAAFNACVKDNEKLTNDAITHDNGQIEQLKSMILYLEEASVRDRTNQMNVGKRMNDDIESSRAEVSKLRAKLQDERASNKARGLATDRLVSQIQAASEASQAKVQDFQQKAKQAEQELVEAKVLAKLESMEFEQATKKEAWHQHQAHSWKKTEMKYEESIEILSREKDDADLRCKLTTEYASQCEKGLRDFRDRALQLQQQTQEQVQFYHNKSTELTRDSHVYYGLYKERKEFAERDSRNPSAESVKTGEKRAQDLKDSKRATVRYIDAANSARKTCQLYEQVLKQQSVLVPTHVEPVSTSSKPPKEEIEAANSARKTCQMYEKVVRQQSVLVPTHVEPVTTSPKEINAAQAIGQKPQEEKKEVEEVALPIRQSFPVADKVELDTRVKAATTTNSQQTATAQGKSNFQAVERKADREAESKEKELLSVRELDALSEPRKVNATRKASAIQFLETMADIPSPKVSSPARPTFHLNIADLKRTEDKEDVGKVVPAPDNSREVKAKRQALVMQQLNTPAWQNAIFQHIQPITRAPKEKAREEKRSVGDGMSTPAESMVAFAEQRRRLAAEKKAKISEASGQETQEEKTKHVQWSNPVVRASKPNSSPTPILASTSPSTSKTDPTVGKSSTCAEEDVMHAQKEGKNYFSNATCDYSPSIPRAAAAAKLEQKLKAVATATATADPSKPAQAQVQAPEHAPAKNHNLDTRTELQKAKKYWLIRNKLSRETADKYLKLAYPDSFSEEFVKGYPEANPNPES